MGNGQRRSGGSTEAESAARAIRKLAEARGLLEDDRVLSQVVVVAQTEDPDGGAPMTQALYPLGAPDTATERAMLRRALDDLRHGG